MGENHLAAHLDGLVKDISAKLAKALRKHDKKAVHEIRVATRRLEAATYLYGPYLSRQPLKQFKQGLKEIRNVLGPLRDFDVMSEHLGEMQVELPVRAFVATHLKAEYKAILLDAKKIQPSRLLRLLADWRQLYKQVSQQPVANLLNKLLLKQLSAFCKRANRQVEPGTEVGQLNPHKLRIAAKELHYTMELAQQAGFHIPLAISKCMRDMQNELGEWHDYLVFTNWLMKLCVSKHVDFWNGELQRALIGLAAHTAERAEQHLEQFGTMWRTTGADALGGIRETLDH